MDSKIISSYQCPMERFHAVPIEFNLKLQSGPSPIQTKSFVLIGTKTATKT